MARTKGPLMSLEASGTIAKTLVYARWKGRPYTREHVIPHNPKTATQQSVRAMVKFISQIYATLSTTIKQHWTDQGAKSEITGMNFMVRTNQAQRAQGNGPYQDFPATAGATAAAPTLTPTAGRKQVTIAISQPPPANTWAWMLWSTPGAVVTPGPNTLIAIVPNAAVNFVHTGLVPGTVYHYKASWVDPRNGGIGTASADVTGTPT